MKGLIAGGILLSLAVLVIGFAGSLVWIFGTTDYPRACGQLCRYEFWKSATLEDVRAEVDDGADVNASKGRDLNSPLHLALSQNPDADIVELLLASGADPNASGFTLIPGLHGNSIPSHRTPLQLAVEQYNRPPRIIGLLLDYGADPSPPTDYDRYDESPLYLASRLWYEGDREIIEMLLDYGADINSRTGSEGLTPLHRAIIGDAEPELIEMLLERGADINTRSNDGNVSLGGDFATIIHAAAEFNPNPEVIVTLLDRGMDINVMAGDGSTPLHLAVGKNENIEIVELLLKRGAEVDARDENGETALHWAIRTQWDSDLAPQRLRLLLDYGADPAVKNINGDSSLHMTEGSIELAPLLLDSGADAGAVNNKGETILHRAFRYRTNFEFTELLLSRGADANAGDTEGVSVLHQAITSRVRVAIIELLLDHGADVAARTGPVVDYRASEYWGQATPLHWAATSNATPQVASLLIARGADRAALNFDRKTPCQIAQVLGSSEKRDSSQALQDVLCA